MGKRVTILLATFALAIGLVFQPYAEAVAAGMPLGPEAAVAEADLPAESSGGDAGDTLGDVAATAGDAGSGSSVDAGDGFGAVGTDPGFEAGGADGRQPEEASAIELLRSPIAQALRAVRNDVITSITANLSSGDPLTGTVYWDQRFRLDVEFALPNGQIQEGDTTVIKLPDELMFYGTGGFALYDSISGDVIANVVIDGAAKTLTLEYTSFPETHSNVSGSFYFLVTVDHNVVPTEQDIDLVFEIGDSEITSGTIHSGPPYGVSEPTMLVKSSWQDSGADPRVFQHTINVNRMSVQIDNAVLTDQKGQSGDAYDKSSLVITKGTWVKGNTSWWLDNTTDVTDQYAVDWAADGLSFTIDFGNIAPNEGFRVTYKTVAGYDPAPGEKFRNDSTLTGTNVETVTSGQTITYYSAGGTGAGYVYSIRLLKQDADTGAALSGAVFNVIRSATGDVVTTVTTGPDGTVVIEGLLKADYKIVEVSPPLGYEPLGDDEAVEVKADEFGDDATAVVSIDNHKETTSLHVVKNWVGPAAESITVELTKFDSATGAFVPTGDTLVLNDDGNWEGSFQNLPKYDDGGQLIEYRVVETAIPGYAATVNYDEFGAVITNTNIETVDVAGSKTWDDNDDQDGARPDSITVRLRAGNNEVDSKVVTADDGWSWAFTGLPKYDSTDGHEIAYSVTEDAVAGYSASYSGYDVTNAHAPGKTSLTVSKAWDDGDDQDGIRPRSVTVRLLANGADTGKAVELDEANGWTASFADLDEYLGGERVTYTVAEDEVDGYAATVTGDAAAGYAITNTHVPQEPTPPTPSKTRAPKTGDAIDPAPIAALAAASFGVLVIALYCGKRRRERE